MTPKGTAIKVSRVGRKKRTIEAPLKLENLEAAATEVKPADTKYEITLDTGERSDVFQHIIR